MNGARAGVLTWSRRLLSRAIAHDLAAFVVPDVRLVRAAGLDPEAAGLALATTPRHATLLLLVGPVPDRLAAAASVTYAQMPRPRSILAVGVSAVPGLPEPDVVTRLDQGALRAAVVEVRRRLTAGAFSPEAPVFEITAVETRTEYVCPMHPEIVRPEPGSCPICGMDLVPRETVGPTSLCGHDYPSPADHAAPAPRVRDSDPTAFTCPMHPEARAAAPGRCPICGMRLVPASSVTDHAAREHEPGSMAEHGRHERAEVQRGAHGDHGPWRAGHEAPAAGDALAHGHGVERGATGQDATNHAAMDHSEHHGHVSPPPADDERVAPAPAIAHTAMEHGDTGHDTMNHSAHGGGFMSMVAMTRDLPRSDDGLPMEWIDVPFGPLFPGLPGGLDLTFTLDGDGVARAVVTEATARGLEATWAGPASTFPGRLARLDPLTPVAYRLLARRALETVAGVAVDPAIAAARIREVEWERIVNHLGWLAEFGFLIGDQWLAASAATLHVAAARTGAAGPGALIGAMRRFVARVPRVPLLDRRLEGIGESAGVDPELMRGPVARAAGIASDARLGDDAYTALGFSPVVRTGGDALARLQVRLGEISASLDLVLAATSGPSAELRPARLPADLSGSAGAAVETPRGMAGLHIAVERGMVTMAHIDPPSVGHAALVPALTTGAEVADALVAVASLDLSPWEVAP